MRESLKGTKPLTPEQLELLQLMQRIRDAWNEKRAKRVQVIQDLHC